MESSPDTPRARSRSRSRGPRGGTPLRRPSSRSSLRASQFPSAFPLDDMASKFEELSIETETFESHLDDLKIMHNSINRFNENFASFLYGLNMNAFCIGFSEAPEKESFQRVREKEEKAAAAQQQQQASMPKSDYEDDGDTTFMTTGSPPTHPVPEPTPAKRPVVKKAPATRGGAGRGARGARGGTGIARGRGTRGSGLSFR